MIHSADTRQNWPGLGSVEFSVSGDVSIETESSGDIERYMVLVPSGGSRQGRGLLPGARRAFPGELQTAASENHRIAFGALKMSRPIVKERLCRLGLKHTERRDGESLDVPHHVTEIVVIIMPGRQAEDRGGSWR